MNNQNVNKIAIVTGAGGGIGSAISKSIISKVNALILIDIDEEKLNVIHQTVKRTTTIPILCYRCDVGCSKSIQGMVNNIEDTIGIPNIIINNAGVGGPFHRVDQVSDDEWYEIINTNLKGVFNLSRILLPKMKEINYGKIINIASVQGYMGAALSSTYVASKHGVIGYTRAIAAEWGIYGITCNAICPGYVDTKMGIQNTKLVNHQNNILNKTPAGRLALPSEIAELVISLLNDQLSFINGSIITIDGGLTCHLGTS